MLSNTFRLNDLGVLLQHFRGHQAMPTRYWIYFIEADGQAIKIGIAGDLSSRLKGLQGGNHLPLSLRAAYEVENPRTIEAQHHTMFAASRMSGEWFAITPALERHIERIASGDLSYLAEWSGTGRVRTAVGIQCLDIYHRETWGIMSDETREAYLAGQKFEVDRANTARGVTVGEAA